MSAEWRIAMCPHCGEELSVENRALPPPDERQDSGLDEFGRPAGYVETPDDRQAGLREAVESAIRLAEAIPYSADVEQAGMQAEVVIATLRDALSLAQDSKDEDEPRV